MALYVPLSKIITPAGLTAVEWTQYFNRLSPPLISISTSGSYTPSLAASDAFAITQTGNLTINAPINGNPNSQLKLELIQDAIGGRAITFNPVYKFPGGSTPTWLTTPGAINFIDGFYDGVNVLVTGTSSTFVLTLPLITINTQVASYSLLAADCAPLTPTMVQMNVAGANTLTYPLNATIPIAIGSVVGWMQYGAGQITHTPAGGVTLRTSSSLTSRAQYSDGTALKIGTDEWLISGDLT